jgi:hypothetical protein
MTAVSDVWRVVQNDTAKISCGPLEASVFLDARGGPELCVRSWQGKPLADFAVSLAAPREPASAPWTCREAYVRGSDLVVTFAPFAADLLAPQIYLRTGFDSQTAAVSIEWIISLQTELLDSRPGLIVQSYLRNAAIHRVENLQMKEAVPIEPACPGAVLDLAPPPALLLARHASAAVSFAQVTQPADCSSMEVEFSAPEATAAFVRTKLVTDRMEKGVIRRARICGWFLPVENDLQVALELARQFIEEPLPLTT